MFTQNNLIFTFPTARLCLKCILISNCILGIKEQAVTKVPRVIAVWEK